METRRLLRQKVTRKVQKVSFHKGKDNRNLKLLSGTKNPQRAKSTHNRPTSTHYARPQHYPERNKPH